MRDFNDILEEIWDLISQCEDRRCVIYLNDESYDEDGSIFVDSDIMYFTNSSLSPTGCNVQGRPYFDRQINGTDHRYQTMMITVANSSGEYDDLLYAIQDDLFDEGYECWLRNDGNLLAFSF